jgi:hypothetical protein
MRVFEKLKNLFKMISIGGSLTTMSRNHICTGKIDSKIVDLY